MLAACAGIRKMDFLFENQPEIPEAQELEHILFGLYEKRLLLVKEDCCELKPEILSIFQNIKDAGQELQIYGKDGDTLLCFQAEQTVVMEIAGNQKDTVRLHSLSSVEFLKELSEGGILPAPGTEEVSFGTAQENLQWLESYLDGWEELEADGIIRTEVLSSFMAEREKLSAAIVAWNPKNGRDAALIFVLDAGLYDWLIFLENGRLQADDYTADSLWAYLNRRQEAD